MIESWGTPNNISAQQPKDEFILVIYFLSERYEQIKVRLELSNPLAFNLAINDS